MIYLNDHNLSELNPIHVVRTGDGSVFSIIRLIWHVALYKNIKTNSTGFTYGERYCIDSEKLALQSILEYESCGHVKYWRKWHNRRIVISGNTAFNEDDAWRAENPLYQVDWLVD